MKKIALGLLVIAMFLCLTACSQDQYAKLGELMGKMSTNVYGIKPNMKDVDAATSKIDATVDTTGGSVTVELNSENAQNIVASVVLVSDSSSLREALQESLEQPILGEDAKEEQKTAVRGQIANQATQSKIVDTTGYTEERKELANAVNEALDLVENSLSDNPTKAELATVAVIKTLSDAVKAGEAGEGYAQAGKKAIDALTLTTEAAGIDLFADADLKGLLGNLMGKGISRDGSTQDFSKMLPIVSKSVAGIIRCMTNSKGEFSDQRYNKFIMECRAIKAAFEMMAKAYSEDEIDAILKKDIDLGLTIESLGRYAISLVFVELTDLSKPDAEKGDGVRLFIEHYVNNNYAALMDIANKYNELDNPMAENSKYSEDIELATGCLVNGIVAAYKIEISDTIQTPEEFVAKLKESIEKLGSFVSNTLSVTGMILVDSEYTSLLKMGDMDGTLSGLLDIITGKKEAK